MIYPQSSMVAPRWLPAVFCPPPGLTSSKASFFIVFTWVIFHFTAAEWARRSRVISANLIISLCRRTSIWRRCVFLLRDCTKSKAVIWDGWSRLTFFSSETKEIAFTASSFRFFPHVLSICSFSTTLWINAERERISIVGTLRSQICILSLVVHGSPHFRFQFSALAWLDRYRMYLRPKALKRKILKDILRDLTVYFISWQTLAELFPLSPVITTQLFVSLPTSALFVLFSHPEGL